MGAGRVGELGDVCREVGIARPLFVTGRRLIRLPTTAHVLATLRENGLEPGVFTAFDPNPNEAHLESGVQAFLAGRHDGVVALGGGSSLDLGKLIAFMARQTKPVWDFEDIGDRWRQADARCISPIVAVPTTAGTGSEAGRAAVLIHREARVKKIIFHPAMMPAAAILDPELALSMPRSTLVGSGMDSFAHCLEAYCALGHHPLADGIALEGMWLIKEFLPRALIAGDDLEAQAQLMSASVMGAAAFQKGQGAIHALAHAIGGRYPCHHGTVNAVLLPYVLAFNRPAIEDRIDAAARYLGIEGGYEGVVAFILQFRRQLEIPDKLGTCGVERENIEAMAKLAIQDPSAATNPRLLTYEAACDLLEAAI